MDRERGFLILAQNSANADYVRQARVLARSIHRSQSESIGVSVVVDGHVARGKEFDRVIRLREDDAAHEAWKIHNKWRLWELSPYEKTIWLDADMVILTDLSWWWDRLDGIPIRFCTRPVDYLGEVIRREFYRRVWVEHKLPMVYTGMVYFERSPEAQRIFNAAQFVIREWFSISEELGIAKRVTGDLAFSLAVEMLREYDAVPEQDDFFRFVHMKPKAFREANGVGEKWAKWLRLVAEDHISIDGRIQELPVHYVDKDLVHFFDGRI